VVVLWKTVEACWLSGLALLTLTLALVEVLATSLQWPRFLSIVLSFLLKNEVRRDNPAMPFIPNNSPVEYVVGPCWEVLGMFDIGGWTRLLIACECGVASELIVRMILRYPPSLAIRNNKGKTPLHIASRAGLTHG
jgi:hypothetical protein